MLPNNCRWTKLWVMKWQRCLPRRFARVHSAGTAGRSNSDLFDLFVRASLFCAPSYQVSLSDLQGNRSLRRAPDAPVTEAVRNSTDRIVAIGHLNVHRTNVRDFGCHLPALFRPACLPCTSACAELLIASQQAFRNVSCRRQAMMFLAFHGIQKAFAQAVCMLPPAACELLLLSFNL